MSSKQLLTITTLFISSFIWPNLSYGQTYWSKVFGSGVGGISAIQSAGNGNFLLVGNTDDFKGLILKIKPNGDTINSTTYSNGSYTTFSSIHPTCEGNFLIAGSMDGDGLILKINQNGDTLWTKTYKKVAFNSVQTTNDCNFLIAGTQQCTNVGTDGLVMKIKSDGSIIWSKTYFRKEINDIRSIQPSGDDNFLLTGITYSISDTGTCCGWLVKINPDGDTIWSKTYQRNPDSFIYAIKSSGDGNFLLAGWTRSLPDANEYDGWIVKIKSNGDTIWTRTYDINSDDQFSAMQPTSDNNFILTGNTWSGDIVSGLIVKMKPNGDTIWTRTVGKSTVTDFRSIKLACDGNFLITGFGSISILSMIADQYANKNQKFTYEIPLYGGNPSNFSFSLLNVPSGMTVSAAGIVSWTPKTDSVYMAHAEILVSNDLGRNDTLTFNIFVNYDYKTQNVPGLVQVRHSMPEQFDITIISTPGHVKFNLPPNTGALFIYDIKGRIIDKITPARSSTGTCISWPYDPSSRSTIHSGKYFIKTTTGKESKSKLFVLMK